MPVITYRISSLSKVVKTVPVLITPPFEGKALGVAICPVPDDNAFVDELVERDIGGVGELS
jgi:hypothetical protein